MELPVTSIGYGQPDFSLLPAVGDSEHFDYMAFLQEDDPDYMAEDSSNSTTTNRLTDSSLQTITPQSSITIIRNDSASGASSGSPPKQRLERRGHTKSRRGCFNCKRRRIKCQENRPACGHCVKTGLKCEYPSTPQVNHQPSHQIPLFSLQDMRFFQHFLMHCYPHYPLGNEGIWTHEIPCLSQNYEYLMHAILGLSASELINTDPSLVTAAMTHRLKAIKAIKKTLSDAPRANTFEEGNALMATCFALTFQSVILEDGMAEYMTFIRGIMIVAVQMYQKGAKFLFTNWIGEDQKALMKPLLEKIPLVNRDWVDSAATAVQTLAPLCTERIAKRYHELLLVMITQLYQSSFGAYKSISDHYGWWIMLPHDDFQKIIDTDNPIMVLLATHWIAIKQIMATITEKEHDFGKRPNQDKSIDMGIIRWLKWLNRRINLDYLPYNQWPMWVELKLDQDRGFFGRKPH